MDSKPGRNDLCPCGSGKKFKRCCALRQPPASAVPAPAARASTAGLGSAEMIELVGLHQAGRFVELERRARELSQRNPQAGLAWKALAVALKMQGKDSLPAAQKAAELLPQDAEAQTNLGVALWEAARVPEAISCLQRAIHIRPDDPSAHYRLGNLLLEIGRL